MKQPREHSCVDCEPWLCQGDIFASTLVLDYPELSDGKIVPQLRVGPAMLVTHDCDLDKATASGKPKVERFSFVRLRSVEALPADRIGIIRTSPEKLQPYEAQYLGVIPGIGESYVLVSDPYFLPASYFGFELREYPDHPEPNRHLTITKNNSRIYRLSDPEIALFRAKWNIHWTRQAPPTTES